ncbi:primosomal protein N' [Streptacidiphilus sp. P02-A3a]|uniref:primosomal protein N' n=1 Tax=Streptacidiphilus sp. P02-A3a TaxID=2704468 RepID=UPI0015FDDEBD|nr:primosomal protein N' [Streptacidiphilus sp. P02-A3a]QMU68768.1 primosomal protein N' [Streptacidiphilus sp. P02-A3a]
MAATDPVPAPPPAPPGEGPAVQLELVRAELRKARSRPKQAPSAVRLPVARVVVDKGLSHLDRYFDYSVPARLDETAQPGVRVRVRFGGHVVKGQGRREGGTLIDGYIVERRADSDFSGPLSPLSQVLSPEPVLTPELLRLCRAVADRYAGPLADVLQLAIPPKHNRAEAEPSPAPLPPPAPPAPGGWARYPQGPEFLAALAAGRSPRAVWTALPGPGTESVPPGAAEGWPVELARAVAATLASGRGALVLLPDGRAVARLDAALLELLGSGQHVALTAGLGPEERYRRWLAVSRGSVRAVAGTRAAMFAPLADLGLVAVWDDGDSGYSDQHVPFPHARDVLLLRAAEAGAAALIGGFAVSVESAQLLRAGWAAPLAADREQVRRTAPLIRTVGDQELAADGAAHAARLPTLAWRTAREALAQGPVLVQVPRRGYVPRLACARCRTAARCGQCAGPLEARDADGPLHCGWCGRPDGDWRCRECGFTRLRAQVVGARRTAEELGRAFPAVPVRTSGRDDVLAAVPGTPALVVATPGAEPVAEGGYAAALLLDAWALLNRPDLRAGEEALRRWLGAAALVRPQEQGGRVVVVAEATLRPVQALVRWDPAGFAATELGERAELGFPPVSRMASLTGSPDAVADLLALIRLPPGADVLGPVELPATRGPGGPERSEPSERVLLRVAPGQGAALATAVKSAYAARMARKQTDPVRIRIDPPDIG